MICPNCKTECSSNFCPNCGAKLNQPNPSQFQTPTESVQTSEPYIEVKDPKGKWPAFFLCLFLGWLGAHRLYTKKYISAAAYLLMLFIFPLALPFCIIYDLFTIITNSFFWDHKQMVARYQASENKNKIEGWFYAFIILIALFVIFTLAGIPIQTSIGGLCAFSVPIFGILTLDSYRKGKPYTMPLILCLIFLLPFLAHGAGIISL